jgi:hypothetical protein
MKSSSNPQIDKLIVGVVVVPTAFVPLLCLRILLLLLLYYILQNMPKNCPNFACTEEEVFEVI